MAGTADPKLIHLIGRLLQSKQREDVEVNHKNINTLVQQLCHQHREYQRKNVVQLTRDVQSAVTHWQQREANGTNPNDRNLKMKKRKHQPLASTVDAFVGSNENEIDEDENDEQSNKGYHDIDREDEDDYDRAAIKHDNMIAAATVVSGNSLNDRLLQIRTVKKASNGESIDKMKHSAKTLTKSSFRIDIIDSQDEISEQFADGDDIIPQVRSTPTDNSNNNVHNVSAEMETQTKDTENLTSKISSIRKRKLVRRSSSRVNGDSKNANLVSEGQTVTSLSFTTPVVRPTERYSDLGGMDHIITNVRQLVEYPITRPELYRHLGVDPPRGVLLRGPPGT